MHRFNSFIQSASLLLLLLVVGLLGLPMTAYTQGGVMISSGTQVVVDGNASWVIVDGKWQNDGTFAAGTGLVRIEGNGSTANTTIGGLSTNGNFYDLTLDKASNAAQLANHIVVGHRLTLARAALDLNTHRLSISSSDSDAVVRVDGYLLSEQTNNSSAVAWFIGSAAGVHTIPFGTVSGNYIPVKIQVTAGNLDTAKVSTYPTNAANLPLPASPTLVTNLFDDQGLDNSTHTVDRFWEINPTGATGVISLTLTAQASELGTVTILKAQRWDSLSHTWDAPVPGQLSSTLAVTVPNVSKFTSFAITQELEPLRVEFLSFDAYVSGSIVVLKWLTASEINSDFYSVQRSADGYLFTEIGRVAAAGNSQALLHYTQDDNQPLQGRSFYRIVGYDNDGATTTTEMRTVYFETQQSMSYAIYPNPTSQGNLRLRILGGYNEDVTVSMTDAVGRVLFRIALQLGSNTVDYSFENIALLSKGSYIVWIDSQQGMAHIQVIVL